MSSQFPAQGRMPALIPQRTESLWYPFSSGVEQMHDELFEEEEQHAQSTTEIRLSGSQFIPIGMKKPFMQDAYHEDDDDEEDEDEGEEDVEEGMDDADDEEDTPTEILGFDTDVEDDEVEERRMRYDSNNVSGDEQGPDAATDYGQSELECQEYVDGDGGFVMPDVQEMEEEEFRRNITDDSNVFWPNHEAEAASLGRGPEDEDEEDEGDISHYMETGDNVDRHRVAHVALQGDRRRPYHGIDPYLQHHLEQDDELDEDDGGAHVYDLSVPSELALHHRSALSTSSSRLVSAAVGQVEMGEEDSGVVSSTSTAILQTPRRRYDGQHHHRQHPQHPPLSPTTHSPAALNAIRPVSRRRAALDAAPASDTHTTTTLNTLQHQQQRHPSSQTPQGPHVLIYEDPPEPDDNDIDGSHGHRTLQSSPEDHYGYRYRL